MATGASSTNKAKDLYMFGQFTSVQCDNNFKVQMFQVHVNDTGNLIRSELPGSSLSNSSAYGDVLVTKVDDRLIFCDGGRG
jgi:hypothetical protein